jgi:hypothetical protein
VTAITDELSDIDIPLAAGTGIVAAGVGLRGDPPIDQPGTINIDVPGAVKQVLVYWEGHMTSAVGDPEITVGGETVTGTLIGGPTNFFLDAWSSVYPADITALNLVNPGPNSIEVGGMDYNRLCPVCTNNGVGLLVIYDDGGDPVDIAIKDGLDLAFYLFDPPLDTTVPRTFDFDPSDNNRVADLVMFASSIAPNRPNVAVVTIGGDEQRFVDPFYNADGPDWDTAIVPVDESGNWTHSQKHGPAGQFTFHAGTPSAPPGTEISWIECSDPGWCVQARPAPAKQIDFGGVGTFKNVKNNVPAEIADYVTVGTSLHYFEVNIDDGGEPGRSGKQDPPAAECPPDGFGRWGSIDLVDCECPDFYRITIYAGPTDASPIIYEASGWIHGGNLQIHPPTRYDLN